MSTNHTKEPWQQGKIKNQKDSPVVLIPINSVSAIMTTNPEDARRAIACVNRCTGMSTEFLEEHVDLFTPKNLLIEQNEKLKRLNGDLLMGLRQMMEDCKLHDRLAKTVMYAQKILKDAEELS